MLQMIAVSMRCVGRRAMFYLAVAVSDYYVPWKLEGYGNMLVLNSMKVLMPYMTLILVKMIM
jgi:hypothetical protein